MAVATGLITESSAPAESPATISSSADRLVSIKVGGGLSRLFFVHSSTSYPDSPGTFQSRMRMSKVRSEEHTSELQSLMRISYAVFCLKKKKEQHGTHNYQSYCKVA